MPIKTVRVSNVSLRATEQDIRDFFTFSGYIDHIELRSETDQSQEAYITYKDSQAVHTALLLSGATMVDRPVNIFPVDDHWEQPPNLVQNSSLPPQRASIGGAGTAVSKAEDVVTTTISKGFILGKDALDKAKTFDEKHQLRANASTKIMLFDKKLGLTEKITLGTTVVNERVRDMDEKFQVSEKAKSAFAAAEEKVNDARSALLKNKYVFTGAAWMTDALNKVTKAAKDAGLKTKETKNTSEPQMSEQSSMAVNQPQHPRSGQD